MSGQTTRVAAADKNQAVIVPKLRLNDGHQMPVIGLGTYKTGDIESVIRTAVRCGYRHFDCAHIYGNEADIGRALGAAIASGEVKRQDLFITTKVWPNWFASGRPTRSARESLARFGDGIDYLDLLLIHWPTPFGQSDTEFYPLDANGQVICDETIDLRDVWREFDSIAATGIARSIGVSNFNSRQLQSICSVANTRRPAVNQIESHPYLSNDRLIDYCRRQDIAVTVYSPLARIGYRIERSPLDEPLIRTLADKYRVSPAQVCIRWQTQRPGVAVIPKSSSEKRLLENINVFGFELTADELRGLASLDCNLRTAKHDHFGSDRHKEWPFADEY
ncbi:1,5-anhydro-D-fructose reductase-like [Oppia nitens]|uniref:1,5-anhydro-D-fructose reductase-like n=1 Tax=Oppia nitens TaxID=1686743 RepID=UPI0023DB297D|nr:1,5-anhydro-D-fructose reductase-like [Oppia nitens]